MKFKELRERRCDTRKPRRRIVLSCEGRVTEIQYFSYFKDKRDDICIKFVNNRHHKSAPNLVLEDLIKYLEVEPLKRDDEAWIVIDYDDRSPDMIQSVIDGLNKIGKKAHLALSNPNFEFWLLLHFDKGAGIQTKTQCKTKLATFIPNYDKTVPCKVIEHVKEAIARAEAIDRNSNSDWPMKSGTTVYKLVKLLISENKD